MVDGPSLFHPFLACLKFGIGRLDCMVSAFGLALASGSDRFQQALHQGRPDPGAEAQKDVQGYPSIAAGIERACNEALS